MEQIGTITERVIKKLKEDTMDEVTKMVIEDFMTNPYNTYQIGSFKFNTAAILSTIGVLKLGTSENGAQDFERGYNFDDYVQKNERME